MSGVEEGNPHQLLGIPQAPGGKGKEEFIVMRDTVDSWKSRFHKKQIGPIVFDDTTLSNSGEYEGVCR